MVTPLESGAYHKTLRVSAVVLAAVLLFESGFFSPVTAQLSQRTEQYLASAVGITVGVPENGVNQLTTRIAELEAQVVDQSTQLRERDLNTGLGGSFAPGQTTTYLLSGILFILLLLIVLNYVLDFYRTRQSRYETTPLA